jgi:hypothetical protein
MNKIILAIIAALLAILAVIYVFRTMSYNEPRQTNLYCLESSSDDRDALHAALVKIADEDGLTVLDRSNEVARELDSLDRPRPEKVLHGTIKRKNDLVLSYSNLGSNSRTFYLSFYSKDYERVSRLFDQGIREAATPLRSKVIAGGAFDDSFCEG